MRVWERCSARAETHFGEAMVERQRDGGSDAKLMMPLHSWPGVMKRVSPVHVYGEKEMASPGLDDDEQGLVISPCCLWKT